MFKLLQFVLGVIPNEHLKVALKAAESAALDAVEKVVESTDNDIDDALVMPIIKNIRRIHKIEEEKERLTLIKDGE